MAREFIDLGLPSGRLWAAENAAIDGKTYFNFDEAVKTFGKQLPSADAWQELFDQCSREWDKDRKGYVLTGPNGNTLFLPADGWQDWNKETKDLNGGGVYGVGSLGLYWSSTPSRKNNARSVYFDRGYVSPTPQGYSDRLCGFSVRLYETK